METPKFKHDCSECIFLGLYKGNDLYFCRQGGSFPTVISRYGNDGPDYSSGMEFATPNINPILFEAKQIAIKNGLL